MKFALTLALSVSSALMLMCPVETDIFLVQTVKPFFLTLIS